MSTSAERMRRLRERRGAGLEAVPDAPARGGDDALLPAVERSIEALALGERDAGLAQMARLLAMAVDDARDPAAALKAFGPQLHKVLASLGATPAPRAKGGRRVPERSAPSRLAQLRAAHLASPAVRKRRGAS